MRHVNVRSFGLIAAVALLSSSLLVYRPQYASLWWQSLFEWLHVPIFGLIAITLLALTPRTWPRWQRFGAALVGSLALALLTEAAQIPMARSASVKDLVSDMAGAISFLLAAAAFRSRLVLAIPALAAAGAIVYWSASPFIAMSQAFRDRNAGFPVLFAGDALATPDLVIRKNMRMETGWDQEIGRLYTRAVWPPGVVPSIQFIELYPDWSGFDSLVLYVEVETAFPVTVTVRVHDEAHRRGRQSHNDRYNRRITLDPGFNAVRIPVGEIEDAPRGRRMNMRQIEALVVFSVADEAERILRFYEFRLE